MRRTFAIPIWDASAMLMVGLLLQKGQGTSSAGRCGQLLSAIEVVVSLQCVFRVATRLGSLSFVVGSRLFMCGGERW